MEVHAHTHTARKKWGHYFWEFFMLFLAVTLGFFVENQREHIVEHRREVKYAGSLLQDLEADTTNLSQYAQRRALKRVWLDSLTILLSTGKYKEQGNDTYYYGRRFYDASPFVSTDGTMQQLKNAGNMRLIKNEKIVKEILEYDIKVRDMKEWDEADQKIRTSFREIGGTIFKADIFYHLVDTAMNFIRPTNNPQLITDDMTVINKVAFQVQYLAVITLANSRRAIELKEKATHLIAMIKNEYNF
jgi:hypothetical protein